ncbi:MAG: hypothetical protein N2691_02940 [Patescibacteria group bacterium]|nr:hypothetical protein [Patescibacteria group bacterium]
MQWYSMKMVTINCRPAASKITARMGSGKTKDISDAILKVLDYYAVFAYPPLESELYRFLGVKTTRERFTKTLHKMRRLQLIAASQKEENRYCHFGSKKIFEHFYERKLLSQAKLDRSRTFFQLIRRFPVIRYAAISGSLSMLNGHPEDDVDVFLVTARGRMWSGRLVSLLSALALGKKRPRGVKHAPDALCLNLYFDARNLTIPRDKQNEYIGHELLQLRPVFDLDGIGQALLQSNSWIYTLFPNAAQPHNSKEHSPDNIKNDGGKVSPVLVHHEVARPGDARRTRFSFTGIGDFVERLARALQLPRIQRHTTRERITDTQLWFFPDDFQDKLSERIVLRHLS